MTSRITLLGSQAQSSIVCSGHISGKEVSQGGGIGKGAGVSWHLALSRWLPRLQRWPAR